MPKLILEIGMVGIAALLTLSCSQVNLGAEQKWLTFRCTDGQTVMARFESQQWPVDWNPAFGDQFRPEAICG